MANKNGRIFGSMLNWRNPKMSTSAEHFLGQKSVDLYGMIFVYVQPDSVRQQSK